MPNKKITRLLKIAQDVALNTQGFFAINGPGIGNNVTNAFMKELQSRAMTEFKTDYAEQKICGDNGFAVDFYFPDEATIVEVALSLSKPNTEYEKDVLKAVMAKEMKKEVNRLMFISKPGASRKCDQPGRKAIKDWLNLHHKIVIEVHDLVNQ